MSETIEMTYRRSEQISDLFTALGKAQGLFANAEKVGENPHFHSRYATLEAVIEATKQGRVDNNLVVIQMPVNIEDAIGVTTLLGHSSGQWIESTLAVPPGKYDAQGAGSVITYLRRYSLMAVLGIAAEDDDGEAASSNSDNARPLSLVRDKTCPNCHKTGTLVRNKQSGLWQCWRSKGGCESAFTDEALEGVPQGTVQPSDVDTPPTEEDKSERMSEKIVATDEMLAPLLELISKSSDAKATEAAILSRCGVKKLSDLTPKQVEWQVSTLQKKVEARESKRPRK